jgi:hypothetical protein
VRGLLEEGRGRPDTNDEADWIELQNETTAAMRAHVVSFVTPVSGALPDGTGKHVGTGGYIEYRRRRLLLTNDHVAAKLKDHSIAHKFAGSDE